MYSYLYPTNYNTSMLIIFDSIRKKKYINSYAVFNEKIWKYLHFMFDLSFDFYELNPLTRLKKNKDEKTKSKVFYVRLNYSIKIYLFSFKIFDFNFLVH